jgi:hypothetical protein
MVRRGQLERRQCRKRFLHHRGNWSKCQWRTVGIDDINLGYPIAMLQCGDHAVQSVLAAEEFPYWLVGVDE